jgi:hypothetical protein
MNGANVSHPATKAHFFITAPPGRISLSFLPPLESFADVPDNYRINEATLLNDSQFDSYHELRNQQRHLDRAHVTTKAVMPSTGL